MSDHLIGKYVKCPGCKETFTAKWSKDDDQPVKRPSRRRKSTSTLQPHRGTLWSILGLLSVLGWFIGLPTTPLGPFVWWLAAKDLKEMDAGRMDPEGRQATQIGKICGIIATSFLIVGLLALCGIILFMCIIPMMFFGGAAAGGQH